MSDYEKWQQIASQVERVPGVGPELRKGDGRGLQDVLALRELPRGVAEPVKRNDSVYGKLVQYRTM